MLCRREKRRFESFSGAGELALEAGNSAEEASLAEADAGGREWVADMRSTTPKLG